MPLTHVALTIVFAVTAPASASLQANAGTLEGTTWKVVELAGTAVPPQSTARAAHLVFGAGGRLSGSDSCNRITGSYTLAGNGVTFGQIAATRMACPDTAEIERRFHGALKGTSHWSIVSPRLELYGATGKPLAILERWTPPPPPGESALQGTTWQLVKFVGGDGRILKPDDRAKYSIEFADAGRMNARIDCNRGRATWKAAGASGPIELGPLALTRAKCPAGSMHDQMVRLWGYIRSYLIKDGHLFLSLMADGGSYEFEPVTAGQKP
jgi:heat shock protein HslJ